MIDLTTVRLYEAVCCRVWPVTLTAGLGRCKYCGQVPKITGLEWDEYRDYNIPY